MPAKQTTVQVSMGINRTVTQNNTKRDCVSAVIKTVKRSRR